MRKLLVLLTVLGPHLIRPVLADDSATDPEDSGIVHAVAEVPADEVAGDQIELASGTADRSIYWRPGLLGQRYFESRYHHFDFSDDPFVELFDDSIQGLDGTLNIPIPGVREESGFLGIDAFVGHRYLGVSGEVRLPNYFAGIEVDQHVTYVGASFYIDNAHFGAVRPFIQLGLEFISMETRTVIGNPIMKETEDDTDLLVAPGLEIDLGERAAIRATADLVGDDLSESTFFGDVIVWPWDIVFIRGGITTPFNGEGIGGTIGAGVVF